jgi:glutathione S-transferase
MASFKLYGIPPSTYTRIVALIAKERNIPYEFVPVNLQKGEHKQEAYLAHHPFGQVPYITVRRALSLLLSCVLSSLIPPFEQQDDGFELYESRAIGRYLATLGSGPELIPTEPKARAKFEQAASIEHAQFDQIASDILFERMIKQYIGQTTNEERVKELTSQLESKLDGYEAILGRQKYLAGDVCSFSLGPCQKASGSDELFDQDVTLADLFHLPVGNYVFGQLGLGSLEKRPNIQRQAICPSLEIEVS